MYTSLVSKIVKAFGIDLNNTDDDEYDYLSRNNETSLYTYMADIYCDREGQHLQLSDCPVLMRIDKPVDVCAYDLFVDAFLTHYEKST